MLNIRSKSTLAQRFFPLLLKPITQEYSFWSRVSSDDPLRIVSPVILNYYCGILWYDFGRDSSAQLPRPAIFAYYY